MRMKREIRFNVLCYSKFSNFFLRKNVSLLLTFFHQKMNLMKNIFFKNSKGEKNIFSRVFYNEMKIRTKRK